MKEGNKLRCDHCGKWQPLSSMVTLPEELYPILTMDNEFGVCWECSQSYNLEYWKQWIPKARKRLRKGKNKMKCTSCGGECYNNQYPELVFKDKNNIICEECSIDYEEVDDKVQYRKDLTEVGFIPWTPETIEIYKQSLTR